MLTVYTLKKEYTWKTGEPLPDIGSYLVSKIVADEEELAFIKEKIYIPLSCYRNGGLQVMGLSAQRVFRDLVIVLKEQIV